MWKYSIRFKKKTICVVTFACVFLLFIRFSLIKYIFNQNVPFLSKNILLIKRYSEIKNPLLKWQPDFILKSRISNFEVIAYDKNAFQKSHLQFHLNKSDIIVFIHIQKTGGSTFNRHLVYDLTLGKCPQRKNGLRRFRVCFRPNEKSEWLFSRFSTQIPSPCGLHADWTTSRNCIPQYFQNFYEASRRYRYFYITILREPTKRFLSEWKHTNQGATWSLSFLQCENEYYSFSTCFNGTDWKGVSLDDFLNCSHNWANNRMTRMLADLSLINCTGDTLNQNDVNDILLKSAKKNLESMPFFGINEKQEETQFMFESVFDLTFNKKFTFTPSTTSSKAELTKRQKKLIRHRNNLDIDLYRFAVEVFNKRYDEMKANRNKKF